MKKLVIGIVAITMSVALTACGNTTESTALNSLSNQLDETSHVVSNIQTVNPADVSITKPSLESLSLQSDRLYNNAVNTQTSLLNEDYYKMEILNRTRKIKTDLSKEVKLSKAQANAIKDLTSVLAKYTNSVSYTRNELDSTVKSISSLKKNTEKNAEKINAKLLRLASNSNTRSCYYQNILNTLDQIEDYITCEDCEKPEENENKTENENGSLKKNIDTYLPNESEENKTVETPNQPVMPIYNSNNFNRLNYRYMNGANGMYGAYGNGMNPNMYNGMNPYGFNNMYGYENGAYGVNPARNTDTYGPMMRNIDTYKDVPATKLEKEKKLKSTDSDQDIKNNKDVQEDNKIKSEDTPRLESYEEVENGVVKNIKSFDEIKQELETEREKREETKPTQARILDIRKNGREQETSVC